MAIEAFKLGYKVTEGEEFKIENGEILMSCEVISESALLAELIDVQVEQLFALTQYLEVNYDGCGTYFEDPDGKDEESDWLYKND